MSDILEFSDKYHYRLVKDGILIESNMEGKYEKYFSDGTQQYIIEGIEKGREYYQTGKLKKEFRMIDKKNYNTKTYRYNGYFEAYKEYDESGYLKNDVYFSDLNKSISYYDNGRVKHEHTFEDHRYLNKNCYSEFAYYENGNMKYNLKRKYNKDEDFCDLEEFTVYFENGQLNQIIEPDTEKYFVYTEDGEMLLDAYVSRDGKKQMEINFRDVLNYKRVGSFNKWVTYDPLRTYKYYSIEKRYPKYNPMVYLNKEYSYDEKKRVWVLKHNIKSDDEYSLSFYAMSSIYNDFTRITSDRHVLIGEKSFKIARSDTHQIIKEYFDISKKSSKSSGIINNNHIKSELTYINEKLEGEQLWYHLRDNIYDRSIVSRRSNYKNDKLDGTQYEYYSNGKTLLESLYSNGIKIGTWNYFYENGNIKGIEEYNELGQLYQIKKYNLDGFEICNILVNE